MTSIRAVESCCVNSCLQFSIAYEIHQGLFCHLCQCLLPPEGGQLNPSVLYSTEKKQYVNKKVSSLFNCELVFCSIKKSKTGNEAGQFGVYHS
jgi:hypothetical protein